MSAANNQTPPMAFQPGQQQQRPMMTNPGQPRPPLAYNSSNVRPGFVPHSPGQLAQHSPQGYSPQMNRPPPSVEEKMGNMQIGGAAQRPGRSKRVYATVPTTPLPSGSTPPQAYQQQPYQQQQQQPLQQQQQGYQQHQQHHQPQQPMYQQPMQPQSMQQQPMQPQSMQQQPYRQYQDQKVPAQEVVVKTPLGLPPRPNVKPRIDPNQIPSPVQIQLKDEEVNEHADYYYGTCTKNAMPLASTDFRTLDQGNCNPRFMRVTLNEVPQTSELAKDTGLPFGVVIQPLALTHAQDAAVPFVPLHTETAEPTRCSRCKGYVNPWCRFIDGGRKYVCNLCEFENLVPEDQQSPLDMYGKRMGSGNQPELMFGSVEFDVPKDYWNDIEPKPLHQLFAIDVSRNAIQSGMLTIFCQTIKRLLETDGFPQGMKIGIFTFDSSIQFYNLQAGLGQATMMVVSDINDVFVPLSNGLFVDPKESRLLIEGLLDQLPTLYENTMTPNAAFGSAVQVGILAMKKLGGKLSIMQTSLPSIGPGVLKNREDPSLYGTEREKGLFAPQDNFYPQLAGESVQAGVSIDLWLFPPANTYIDVATVGVLSALTGGDTYYFPNFNITREGVQVMHDLTHTICREQGYRAALRVRCSNGISVQDQYGNFSMSNATDMELAGVNSDTTIGVELKHEGKLAENSQVYFQSALLYTTAGGQRRVRVHNLSAGVGATANPVFKHADLDTSVNLLIKRTIALSAKKTINDLSNELDTFCVKVLTAYRKYCATGASAAQLILPESFKVLPLLLSSFKKSAVLRKDSSMNFDARVYNMRKIKNLSIPGTIKWLYPRCIKLHTLFNQEEGHTPLERLSYDRFESTGIYWIESHSAIFLWIGQEVSKEIIYAMFGVSEMSHINPAMNELPVLEESPVNCRLRGLYQKATENIAYLPQLNVIRHGLDLEVELSKVLVEDEIYNQSSYVDYLCMIHKQIQTELEREKNDVVLSAASYWAYRY
ncbi:uncharacterized protein EV154DRAFT_534543 [Mucor mucedo]|uniref:uncharacterized protein n=1 Tax=Mucor mucedo TaxID=29922 RepID=UPI00221E421B|nr:uncharacterized protein EV154DRAFT_534543 [Mucor mucedo]KAI7863803.1 hypothetical protein EV154DRAFT_534543 [Mucor mucedo]